MLQPGILGVVYMRIVGQDAKCMCEGGKPGTSKALPIALAVQ